MRCMDVAMLEERKKLGGAFSKGIRCTTRCSAAQVAEDTSPPFWKNSQTARRANRTTQDGLAAGAPPVEVRGAHK
jgi:hypothetical protein